MVRKFIIILLLSIIPQIAYAEGVVLSGKPAMRINVMGDEIHTEKMSDTSNDFWMIISFMDGEYKWTSRNNTILYPPYDSGIFRTFLAKNGSGYVRILNEAGMAMKQAGDPDGGLGLPHEKYDYVEHLTLGLSSVTYYGSLTTKPWERPWNKLNQGK